MEAADYARQGSFGRKNFNVITQQLRYMCVILFNKGVLAVKAGDHKFQMSVRPLQKNVMFYLIISGPRR